MQYDGLASLALHDVATEFEGESGATRAVAKPDAMGLLQRLGEDDAFRQQMEADPVAAFAEYGIAIDRTAAPASVRLPSKDVIKGSMELLTKQVATGTWILFCR